MVSVHQDIKSDINSTYNNESSRTLCDWVRQFRLKKIQMKRKLKMGGELRVCAILTTALMRTELELKRKQQERFQRWLEFQAKINDNKECIKIYNNENVKENNDKIQGVQCNATTDEIDKLWKCELSDLDNFLRSISSTTVNNKKSTNTSSCCWSPLLRSNNCHVDAAENSRHQHTTLRIPHEQSVVS